MVDARYLVALLALGACAPRAVTSEVIVVPTTTMPSVRWECPRHLDKAELEAAGLPWPGVRGACDSCTTLDGQWVAARHMPSERRQRKQHDEIAQTTVSRQMQCSALFSLGCFSPEGC